MITVAKISPVSSAFNESNSLTKLQTLLFYFFFKKREKTEKLADETTRRYLECDGDDRESLACAPVNRRTKTVKGKGD